MPDCDLVVFFFETPAAKAMSPEVVDRELNMAPDSVRFEYLPHDEIDLQWQPTWDARDEDTLPSAIRLSVEGLAFFDFQPWIHEVPVMTIAYGWGGDEFRDPPDEYDDDFDDVLREGITELEEEAEEGDEDS